jgi:NADPH:quinone reductase
MSDLMRVCEVTEFGEPEVLRASERPWPTPAPGEVLVEIAATAVNPTDLAARTGLHRRRMPDLEPPFVPGWDIAGFVTDPGDSSYAPGDPVVGMIPWIQAGGRIGAYAQAAAVDPAWLAPRAPELDPIIAATIPLNTLTARQGLDLLAVPAGATILITGASGAVGGFATQLAASAGLRVIAMASSGDEQWVAGLGADEVIPRDVDFAGLAPVDALFDAVPIGARAAVAVRDGGAALFTRGVTDVDRERIRVETPLAHPDAVALTALVELAQRGQLLTRVAAVFDLADAAQAHRLAERGGQRGKFVLTPG